MDKKTKYIDKELKITEKQYKILCNLADEILKGLKLSDDESTKRAI